ncbi:type II/IV secretion system ATPase subunit [Oxyplasma meridianum]|uniref:Type II/IV secretion system ATPase subunit n=1 Tax=Oxyplasma meridianum TaxID=3073602 RepID=A0AAX4NHJ1_9ARCH
MQNPHSDPYMAGYFKVIEPFQLRDFEVVDRYTLNNDKSAVKILWDKENLEYIYQVEEPTISRKELEDLYNIVKDMEWIVPNSMEISSRITRFQFQEIVKSYIHSRKRVLERGNSEKLQYFINRDYTGYGIINIPVNDPEIEDISCDGYGSNVFVYHRKYHDMKTNITYNDPTYLDSFIIKLSQFCGKEISINNPVLDGITDQGHRVQAIYGNEISPHGSVFTIRLFRKKPFTPTEILINGTADSDIITYMWYLVENNNSCLISGAPAVGKTSTLNALLMLAPPNSKIFSIEETREINIPNENWIPATTRERENYFSVKERGYLKIDMFELVRMAMRQRPTYIVVGEVRGREAYALFQSMSTGHTTYSTIHADSMDSLINRLEAEPLNIPRVMMTYLSTVIFNKFIRVDGNLVRRITEINEMMGYDPDTGDVLFNNVFSYDAATDKHYYNGNSSILEKIRSATGMSRQEFDQDFLKRKTVIENMAKNGITDYRTISKVIQTYYFNHEEAIKISSGGNS